jgi:hypothetical protein
MGFPAYHVVIPGIHEIYPVSEVRLREFRTQLRCAESLQHFPALSEEEEKRLLLFARFKETSAEYNMGLSFMNYLYGDTYRHERIIAFLALKQADYVTAQRLFRRLEAEEKSAAGKSYYKCLVMLSRLLSDGLSKEAALQHIAYLFETETAERVIYETEDPETMPERAFPHALKCFDCENCRLAGTHCEYPDAADAYRKIKRAMTKSSVSCEELLKQLSGIVKEAE